MYRDHPAKKVKERTPPTRGEVGFRVRPIGFHDPDNLLNIAEDGQCVTDRFQNRTKSSGQARRRSIPGMPAARGKNDC